MSCENYRKLLISQLCGEIQEQEELDLQKHLQGCEECRREQKEFRVMLGLIRQLPQQEWNEELRIRDLLRRRQRWRTIVFSKAALWVLSLTALITVLSYLPIRWELSAHQFSVRWGRESPREAGVSSKLKELQLQLVALQKQNQDWNQVAERRMKQMLDQNNLEQEKRYWQTLQMFTNYMQLQRKAELQKIQREIATTYDRTGQEVEKTNQLLQYVLQASASTEDSLYENK